MISATMVLAGTVSVVLLFVNVKLVNTSAVVFQLSTRPPCRRSPAT